LQPWNLVCQWDYPGHMEQNKYLLLPSASLD
jgi:hypothetical protein